MVYRISMPWLCTLECVRTMQCTVQYGAIHYTHCTVHSITQYIIKSKTSIAGRKKVNNWKGSRWTRFWMVRDILTAVFFSKSHILTIRFFKILANSIYFTKNPHSNCQSVPVHYTILHYLPLHFTTLHYTTLHYTTTTTTQLHSTTLHYTKLHYTTLHYTTLHYIPPHSTTPHYITLHYITLNDTAPQIDR